MAEVKLLTMKWSPFGQRVHMALLEKGIAFELVSVDLSAKPQALLDANPIHKKIPAIIHNGKPVAESLVLLEYLEDAWPEQVPLMPKDPYQRSKVRFWTDYIYHTLFSEILKTMPPAAGTAEEKEAAAKAVSGMFKTIDEGMISFSTEGPFFTGDKFDYLDVVLAPILSFCKFMQTIGGVVIPGPEELPRFHKWIKAVKARPSVIATVPGEDEMFEVILEMWKKMSLASRTTQGAA